MARPPLAAALLLWWRCGLWTLCASTSATTFVPRPLRRESALALLQRLSLDGCKAIILFMGVCFCSLTRPIFPTCHTPTLPISHRQFFVSWAFGFFSHATHFPYMSHPHLAHVSAIYSFQGHTLDRHRRHARQGGALPAAAGWGDADGDSRPRRGTRRRNTRRRTLRR